MSRLILYSQGDKAHVLIIVDYEGQQGGKKNLIENVLSIFGCPLFKILTNLSDLNYTDLIKHPHNDKNETLISFKWSL